jgi:hypothetical protein
MKSPTWEILAEDIRLVKEIGIYRRGVDRTGLGWHLLAVFSEHRVGTVGLSDINIIPSVVCVFLFPEILPYFQRN